MTQTVTNDPNGRSRPKSNRPSVGLRVALAGVASALSWLIVTHSFSAYLAGVDSEWALFLYPRDSQALLNLAESHLSPVAGNIASGAKSPSSDQIERSSAAALQLVAKGIPFPVIKPVVDAGDRDEVRRLSQEAVVANPLSSRAYRMLAEVVPTDGATKSLMLKSAARSMHEVASVFWLMQESYLEKDFQKTAYYGDILLRSVPDLHRFIVPLLARVAESPGGFESVAALLRTNPPWRWYFFDSLNTSVSDLGTPLNFLLDMKAHGVEPVANEVDPYISFLMNRKHLDMAHDAWLKLLRADRLPENALLYNDRLLLPPSGLPFDWTFANGGGAIADLVERHDKPGQRVLDVQFSPGLADPLIARQLLMLSPGSYVFSGNALGHIEAHRGLRWRVACLSSPSQSLGESEAIFGTPSQWMRVSMSFVIPQAGCRAQLLSLGLDQISDSDRIVSGRLWFADINIISPP